MNSCLTLQPRSTLIRTPSLALILAAEASLHAQILWTGSNTNYSQGSLQVPPAADVIISRKVSLTRNDTQWLYNTNVESAANPTSPADTEWAFGMLTNWNHLSYTNFAAFRTNGDLSTILVTVPPSPMVLHLTNEDIYIQVTFTSWPKGGGPFAYTRSTPAVTPPTPSISIIAPGNGSVFAAPANVKVAVNATVSLGVITNVSVFSNSVPLGSSQTSPFNITTTALGAGSYPLTAVATAAGVSGTSAVVNVSVINPVTTVLSAASETNNEFSFSYIVSPGLQYDVENSTDMVNWTPLLTNTPGSSPASFSTNVSAGKGFYRVGRLPNP